MVSADCHVEARRTPKLIYYFNSRSKCLPFVCSCFTISAECRVINDASFSSTPSLVRASASISYYAQAWCRKSFFECCIYWHFVWHFGMCEEGKRKAEGEQEWGI